MTNSRFRGTARWTSILACIVTASCLTSIASAAEPDAKRPNIVLILIDDMGWADIGYHNDELRSPNLDKLAREGVEFGQHYVMQECTPTRVTLMTGRYPNRFGLHCSSASNDQAFPFDTVTMASALRSVGYDTAISGKWHLGSLVQWGPRKFGFNHSYGGLAGALGMYDHRYRLNRAPYTRTWHRNDEYVDEEGHAYDLVTDEAIGLVEKTLREPFFLYLPYHGVHTPLVESKKWLDHNRHIENPSRRLFAAAVSHLDHQIGRVVDTLERTGRRENTLIVVLSDNGGFPNYSGGQYPAPDPRLRDFSSNHPLRGFKGQHYEGGIRVPASANWPGRLEPRKISAPIHSIDWLPTLCKLVGYEPSKDLKWDGQNIWPLVTGERTEHDTPRRFYWNYWNVRIALRDGDWKLVSPKQNAPFELYNLAEDPNETTDLAKRRPDQLKRLQDLLENEQSKDRKGRAPWLPPLKPKNPKKPGRAAKAK